MTTAELKEKIKKTKKEALTLCMEGGYGPISSAFSCADIVCTLYYEIMRLDPANPDWEERDRLILSKNHAGIIVMPVLRDLGFISAEEYGTILKIGSERTSHTDIRFPGMEFSGGALGIGLGVAAGIAYAAKTDRHDFLTFCILGDAECCEGSVWESSMFAGTQKLRNLIAIVDNNGLAVTDYTSNMIDMSRMRDKWEANGWDVLQINGHCADELLSVLGSVRNRPSEKPLCIIADTRKGKGIRFMEGQLGWHGTLPKKDQMEEALAQLEEE